MRENTIRKNWSGNVKWKPNEVAYPESLDAIQALVVRAVEENSKIRVVGSAHSFTSLCVTNDIMISLDKYQGLLHVDREKCQATVKAGTKLNLLGELLFQEGMAMENMGDVDVQSIAGTISTGTHGTGTGFGILSTQVVAIEFINGSGELVKCSKTEQSDLFRVAQVSLGTLGVITAITLQCVPSYKLALQNNTEQVELILDELDSRLEDNRNFEFYYIPYTHIAWTKSSNIVKAEEPNKVTLLNYWAENVTENHLFYLLCETANFFPNLNVFAAKLTASNLNVVRKVYHSHKVYATKRLVRFNEMEYSVPASSFKEVFKEIKKIINSKRYKVHFPIECRWVKGDDIPLSPAYGRDSAYIAVHMYHKKDYFEYFSAIEEVFKAFGGRPHWGKMNYSNGSNLTQNYPEFPLYLKYRAIHDPQKIFLNSYLEALLLYQDYTMA